MDALLSMKRGAGKTLCSYANQYWEMYNEISRGNEKNRSEYFLVGIAQGFRITRLVDKETS